MNRCGSRLLRVEDVSGLMWLICILILHGGLKFNAYNMCVYAK